MTIEVDENGTIKIYQGDTGSLTIEGIPDDRSYDVFFAIQNQSRDIIFETSVKSNNQTSVDIDIDTELSNKLNVPINENSSIYYYGIKLCYDGDKEDTVAVDGRSIGSRNKMIVYPLQVEGYIDE